MLCIILVLILVHSVLLAILSTSTYMVSDHTHTCPNAQVFVSIPACIQLQEGPYIETHDSVVRAFRPAGLIRKEKPLVLP